MYRPLILRKMHSTVLRKKITANGKGKLPRFKQIHIRSETGKCRAETGKALAERNQENIARLFKMKYHLCCAELWIHLPVGA